MDVHSHLGHQLTTDTLLLSRTTVSIIKRTHYTTFEFKKIWSTSIYPTSSIIFIYICIVLYCILYAYIMWYLMHTCIYTHECYAATYIYNHGEQSTATGPSGRRSSCGLVTRRFFIEKVALKIGKPLGFSRDAYFLIAIPLKNLWWQMAGRKNNSTHQGIIGWEGQCKLTSYEGRWPGLYLLQSIQN